MTDSRLKPIKFRPFFKRVVWGGTLISRLKQMPLDYDDLGESWEISSYQGIRATASKLIDFGG